MSQEYSYVIMAITSKLNTTMIETKIVATGRMKTMAISHVTMDKTSPLYTSMMATMIVATGRMKTEISSYVITEMKSH